MSRILLAAVCSVFLPAAAWAALDPELKEPYHLEVVLHIAEHRLLTPVFQDQVERELRDGLRVALGDLARVEVVRDHPLLKAVRAEGLQKALDEYRAVSGKKTHFVLIGFADGQYVIQARQHDGLTGLAGPVVRRAQTMDRLLVAHTAALLLERDFGLVGTVVGQGEDQTVRVALKGGGLGVPLGPWVKKGEVFALVKVSQHGGQVQAERVPWALLQVAAEPGGGDLGDCLCRLFHRHPQPLAGGPEVLGYRCLKLGTTRAPLRFRLVNDDPTRTGSLRVQVSAAGFQEANARSYNPIADNLIQTKESYPHAAFVRVFSGQYLVARIPIEILDDQIRPVPVSVSKEAEDRGFLDIKKNNLVREFERSFRGVDSLFQELNDLVKQGERKTALDKAQSGLSDLQGDLALLREKLASLRETAKEFGLGGSYSLTEADQYLQDLRAKQDELKGYKTNLEEVVKQENDPKRQKLLDLVQQSRGLEAELEFDQAIQLYEQVVPQVEQPQLRRHLEQLQKKRHPRGDTDPHRQARAWLYETWPKLADPVQLKARLEEARKAFQVCQEAGDVLSPQKLIRANLAHAAQLAERLDKLRPDESDDDRQTAQVIADLAGGLKRLTEEVRSYLPRTPAADQ